MWYDTVYLLIRVVGLLPNLAHFLYQLGLTAFDSDSSSNNHFSVCFTQTKSHFYLDLGVGAAISLSFVCFSILTRGSKIHIFDFFSTLENKTS